MHGDARSIRNDENMRKTRRSRRRRILAHITRRPHWPHCRECRRRHSGARALKPRWRWPQRRWSKLHKKARQIVYPRGPPPWGRAHSLTHFVALAVIPPAPASRQAAPCCVCTPWRDKCCTSCLCCAHVPRPVELIDARRRSGWAARTESARAGRTTPRRARDAAH